jgi:hypothetical protein
MLPRMATIVLLLPLVLLFANAKRQPRFRRDSCSMSRRRPKHAAMVGIWSRLP